MQTSLKSFFFFYHLQVCFESTKLFSSLANVDCRFFKDLFIELEDSLTEYRYIAELKNPVFEKKQTTNPFRKKKERKKTSPITPSDSRSSHL